MNKAHLLIIDPQNDFCHSSGALYVNGADQDMQRLAQMIEDHLSDIDQITVTLDSHHYLHIAHPSWWVDAQGQNPNPFTLISLEDVLEGKWKASNAEFQERSLQYVQSLAQGGRYMLCIWPPHCLIGTKGHAIDETLNKALRNWEKQLKVVQMVNKGENLFTEHYSAIRADVEDPTDESTALNQKLINSLKASQGDVLIAGEALSHCVANTIRDLAGQMNQSQIARLVLLRDTVSSVPGFEQLGEDFIVEMQALGMRVSTTTSYYV